MTMDSITPEHRSWNMSRIKGKDTKIEIKVRQYLFSKGFRFRKNDKRYPGKPDVVLPKYKTIIFVNGCFWHQHRGCVQSRLPKSNTEYWKAKMEKNVINDELHKRQLQTMGWTVKTLWECELAKDFKGVLDTVIKEMMDSFHNRVM